MADPRTFPRFPVLLAFWGIPSLLYWIVALLLFLMISRHQTAETEKRLGETLQRVYSAYDQRLALLLNEVFDSFQRAGADRRKQTEVAHSFRQRIGNRRLQFFLFDGNGQAVASPGEPVPPGIDRLFSALREPLEKAVSFDDPLCQPMKPYLHWPEEIVGLRSREGRMVFLGHRDPLERQRIHGYYRWNPMSEPRNIAGMLVVFWTFDFHAHFLMEDFIGRFSTPRTMIGFQSPRGEQFLSQGMNRQQLSQAIDRYRFSASERFEQSGWLYQCGLLDNHGVIVVGTRAPTLSRWLIALVVGLFVAFTSWSFRFSRRLFPDGGQVSSLDSGIRLRSKLIILFLYGAVFPLLSTGTIGLLYLQEKWLELVQAHQTTALNQLDFIDREFEGVFQQRELFYESLHKGFSQGSVTYDHILRQFEKLRDDVLIDDLFVVSSQSELLVMSHSKQRNGYRWLLTRPFDERRQWLSKLMTHEQFRFYDEELECLLGRLSNDEIMSRISHKHTDKLKKLLPRLGRECIAYANESAGLRAPATQATSDLLVDEMVGNDAQASFRNIKLSQGKILTVPRAIGEGYLYVNTFRDPRGHAQYVIFLFHDYPCFQRDYLLTQSVEFSRRHPGEFIRAYRLDDRYSIAYPVIANDPWRAISTRLERENRDHLHLQCGEGSEEIFITARTPKNLAATYLVYGRPAAFIRQQLAPYQLRVFGFMAGVMLICLTLGWILLQRFLVPVQRLAEGVKAISHRDFSHRVSINSRDELGVLGQTLNRTIEYLSEMEMALTIQRTLFPAGPLCLNGIEVTGQNEMTQAVGGDYYDYFTLRDGKAVVLLGDVSGHGVSAALVTAMAKAGFHLLFERCGSNPSHVFEQLNLQMYEILRRKKMMTCICGVIDSEARVVRFTNAGQAFPVSITNEGTPSLCDLVSSPLGVLKRGKFAETTVPLSGAGLILYSDGLIEAVNEHGQMFAYDRFQQTAANALQAPNPNPAQVIFQTVRRFTGSVPWADDATVVIVRPVSSPP